jgi:hypothetical protein
LSNDQKAMRRWAVILLAAASSALAQEPAAPEDSHADQRGKAGLLLRMNMDFGGETLTEVQWSNGDSSTLKAGQLFTFSAGALYYAQDLWALEATIGYKFDKVNGDGGDTIEFTRIPLDVIGSWAPGPHRLGAGATLHFSPTFKCEVAGLCNASASFAPSLGAILQYVFALSATGLGVELGARYTILDYSGGGLPKANGSGLGFFLGIWWS